MFAYIDRWFNPNSLFPLLSPLCLSCLPFPSNPLTRCFATHRSSSRHAPSLHTAPIIHSHSVTKHGFPTTFSALLPLPETSSAQCEHIHCHLEPAALSPQCRFSPFSGFRAHLVTPMLNWSILKRLGARCKTKMFSEFRRVCRHVLHALAHVFGIRQGKSNEARYLPRPLFLLYFLPDSKRLVLTC
jgi:hypothetical protein